MSHVLLISLVICLIELLYSDESRADSAGWSIEDAIGMSKLWSILDHALCVIFAISLHRVDRYALELSPAHRESDWVFCLEHMWVPSVFLDLDPHEDVSSLLVLQAAENHRILWSKLPRELLLDLDLNPYIGAYLEMSELLTHERGSLDLLTTLDQWLMLLALFLFGLLLCLRFLKVVLIVIRIVFEFIQGILIAVSLHFDAFILHSFPLLVLLRAFDLILLHSPELLFIQSIPCLVLSFLIAIAHVEDVLHDLVLGLASYELLLQQLLRFSLTISPKPHGIDIVAIRLHINQLD